VEFTWKASTPNGIPQQRCNSGMTGGRLAGDVGFLPSVVSVTASVLLQPSVSLSPANPAKCANVGINHSAAKLRISKLGAAAAAKTTAPQIGVHTRRRPKTQARGRGYRQHCSADFSSVVRSPSFCSLSQRQVESRPRTQCGGRKCLLRSL
jgi:hypothetical protein